MEFTPRCPTCRTVVVWQGNSHRPFCSERCRLSDLGAWATGQYRIEGAPIEPTSDDDDSNDGSA